MSKEYTIGEWSRDTYLIIKDKEGKIIHHYISCRRIADNAKGIYDLVENTFSPFLIDNVSIVQPYFQEVKKDISFLIESDCIAKSFYQEVKVIDVKKENE